MNDTLGISPTIIAEINASNPFAGYDLDGLTIKGMPITDDLVRRLGAFTDSSSGPDKCWHWKGGTTTGYGYIRHGGKMVLAHRVACTLAHGNIPAPMSALHSCDTPICCNPNHLRPGTTRQNALEMVARGRFRKNVLSAEQVGDIKRLAHTGGTSIVALAEKFGVTPGTITDILSGRNHKRIPCPACAAGTCPQVARKVGRPRKVALAALPTPKPVLAEETVKTDTTTFGPQGRRLRRTVTTRTRKFSQDLDEIFGVSSINPTSPTRRTA